MPALVEQGGAPGGLKGGLRRWKEDRRDEPRRGLGGGGRGYAAASLLSSVVRVVASSLPRPTAARGRLRLTRRSPPLRSCCCVSCAHGGAHAVCAVEAPLTRFMRALHRCRRPSSTCLPLPSAPSSAPMDAPAADAMCNGSLEATPGVPHLPHRLCFDCGCAVSESRETSASAQPLERPPVVSDARLTAAAVRVRAVHWGTAHLQCTSA